MFSRIAKNTGANFAFRLFSMTLALVSVPVLIRGVGAEGYGVILLAESVMGYFALFNAGVPAGTVKYVAEYDARGDRGMVSEIVNTSFTFFLGAGALVAVAVALFAALGGVEIFRISPENLAAATRVLYVAAVMALVAWPAATFGQGLDGLQLYPQNRIAQAVGSTTGRLLAIGAALTGRPLEVVYLCSQSGVLITALLQYRALRRAVPEWRLRPAGFRKSTMQMIFGYSMWMLLQQVAALLFYQTDRIILGLLLPVSAIAIHQVVTTPFRYVQEFSALFNSALTPAVSAAEAREGRAGLDRFIFTAGRYSNALIAPLAILGVFFSGPFIALWVGPEFLPYAWIAQVACAFQLVWQSNSALGRVFYGSGKVRVITVLALVTALVNIPLGLWWTRELGVAGVVLATLAAGCLGVPLQYLFAMPELRIDRRRYFADAVLMGQGTSLALGLLLIPLWSVLQGIRSWPVLILTAGMTAVVFYVVVLRFVLEPQHRRALLRMSPA